MDTGMWFVTFVSIVGVILNIYKNKWCFAIWIFTNATWCVYDAYFELWPQAFLFFVYFLLAVWGLIHWCKEKKA